MKTTGTSAVGLRTPIIREGDDLIAIIRDALKETIASGGMTVNDGDIIGITEAVVARAQGNYATVDQIAGDVRAKLPAGEIGVLFPILSRNRFAMLLKGISRGAERVVVQLSYPADEVGNQLVSWEDVDDKNLNVYTDCLDEAAFRKLFGTNVKHRYTGVDYVEYYKSLGENIEIILSCDPKNILNYTKHVIAADIHTRARTKRAVMNAGASSVFGLDNLLNAPFNGSGYNENYGLLGSNKATEERVKLFPRDCQSFVESCQKALQELTGKRIEVLIYGDGGFKDPVSGIWELADPVVSPAFTSGLKGTPNELKLKYLADNQFGSLSKEDAQRAIEEAIRQKAGSGRLMGKMETEGTTPRHITDLLGSLCDLISGSGDKGTPVVFIQGYFDNYAS